MNIFSRPFVFLCLTAISLISITTVSAQKLFAAANPSSGGSDTTRLLRFPTTNDTQIVFCYAGEIYTVGKEGGIARRLTSGPGYSSFPRFSPDGKQIAFTSQYDGNTEVYVMPAEGGTPKRLTTSATLGRDDISDRMGPNNLVMAWENTKPLVVFRSRMKSFNDFIGGLFTVGLDAELPQQLPVPRGGFVSFSPDDSKMAYNQVFREFRTWKHYRGGMADDVWIYDFKTGATENLTNNPAQDICPMWGPDNKIYFISDRDNRMNLFVIDLATKETKQLTHFTDYDIKFPSIGKDSIVFEQAGYIWRYDLTSGQATPVPIEIKEDLAIGRSALVDAARHIESVNLAPDGERSITVARGDLFSVPAKNGTPRNLTKTSGAHELDAVWSPDGKWIAYNSDVTGENELYVRSQDGKGEPQQITSGADTYYYAPKWSPDSKKLLWSDRLQRLRYIDVATKAITLVDQDKFGEIQGYNWSPDSQWIVWARPERTTCLVSIFTRSPTNSRSLSLIVGMALASQSSATMGNTCCSVQPAISSRRLATKNLRTCIATCSGFISSHSPKKPPTHSPQKAMKSARLNKNDKKKKRRKPQRKNRNKKPLRRSRKKNQKNQLL